MEFKLIFKDKELKEAFEDLEVKGKNYDKLFKF